MSLTAKFLREPLVHFLFFGVCLFVIDEFINGGNSNAQNTIVVNEGRVQKLKTTFEKRFFRPPIAILARNYQLHPQIFQIARSAS